MHYNQQWLLALCVLLTAAIFIADLFIPLGVANAVFYVLVVLIALWLKEKRNALYFAVVCTILSVVGFLLSPTSEGLIWVATANRLLAVFVIWVTLFLGMQRRSLMDVLKENAAYMSAILGNTVDAIITADSEGRIESFNAAAERFFQHNASEILGENVRMLIPTSYQVTGPERELTGVRKDGSEFPIGLSVSELRLNGRVIYTGLIRDLTDRKRLEQEVLRTAEAERLRIGQDLKEGLGQMLTGIGLITKNLLRALEAEAHPRAEQLAQLTEWIQEADQFTESLVHSLVPVEVDDVGLDLALKRLAREAPRLHCIRCSFDAGDPVPVSNNIVATHLFHIAREAVQRAARNDAKHVSLSLKMDEDRVVLCVQDNGNGSGQEIRSHGEMEMRLMKHRASLIGATMEYLPCCVRVTASAR